MRIGDRIIPFELQAARRWGALTALLGNESADLMIAATAPERGLTVAMRNVSGVPVSRSGTARIHIGAACRSAADSIGNKHSPPMQLLFQLLPLYELYGHIGLGMREIQLKDAKANLSAVVDQAARGGPSVITRHGKPEAVVLGFADWQRLSRVPSFGRLLMSAPLEPDDLPERDRTPLRDSAL